MNRQNGLKPVARLIAKLIANRTTKAVQTNAADSGSIPFQPMNRKNLTKRLYMIVTSNNLFIAYFLLWIVPYYFVFVKSYFQIIVFFKHRIVTKSHRFNKKIFIPDFPFVFVIIILIVTILYLYGNNYHLYFVKNKSRGYFTTAFLYYQYRYFRVIFLS